MTRSYSCTCVNLFRERAEHLIIVKSRSSICIIMIHESVAHAIMKELCIWIVKVSRVWIMKNVLRLIRERAEHINRANATHLNHERTGDLTQLTTLNSRQLGRGNDCWGGGGGGGGLLRSEVYSMPNIPKHQKRRKNYCWNLLPKDQVTNNLHWRKV